MFGINMEDGKQDFKTRTVRILRVFAGIAGAVVLSGAVAFFPVSAEETEKQKAVEKPAKHDETFTYTYEITPDTIIPDMFPPNCTENVTVLDGVLISCSIPAPIDELKVAEEKEGGYTDITSYSLEELLIDDEIIRTIPEDIFFEANNVKIYIAKSSHPTIYYPIPYFFFKDRVRYSLNIIGNGGGFLFKITILSPGMQKIYNKKISLANFFPEYALVYYKDQEAIYEVYFMQLPKIELEGKAYAIYSPQSDSFYFLHDERNKIQEYFDTLSSLFI